LNRRVLIGILIAVVGIGLIGLGILAINTVLRQSFAPRAQPTPVVETTQDVVITSHDMAVGAVLNREDIQLASVPVSLIPRDALQTIEAALGKIVTVHLIQGEMVLQHHLADPTNVSHDIGYIIGENEVLMAFPSTDLLSTLGVLQRGDNVDIFATMTAQVVPTNTATIGGTGGQQQAQSQTFTFDAFQRIQISAIVADVVTQSGSSNTTGTAQSTPNPADVRVRAYLLALNAQDALVLKNMRDAGVNFDIVLRSPTSNQLFDVSPVTEEYLVQRFKLQIPR
jgi:Flp pilus assembly protein CpaB